jgi:hypothetical protein
MLAALKMKRKNLRKTKKGRRVVVFIETKKTNKRSFSVERMGRMSSDVEVVRV